MAAAVAIGLAKMCSKVSQALPEGSLDSLRSRLRTGSAVRRILSNETHTGTGLLTRRSESGDREVVRVPLTSPAIVSQEEFEEAQQLRARIRERLGRSPSPRNAS